MSLVFCGFWEFIENFECCSCEILCISVPTGHKMMEIYEPRHEKTGFLHMRKQRRC